MWARALGVSVASCLLSCGSNDLSRGGTPDQAGKQHDSGTAERGRGDASEASRPRVNADASDGMRQGLFCSGTGWSDPSEVVLLGSSTDSVVLVHADGSRQTLAPVPSGASIPSWVKGNGFLAVRVATGSNGSRIIRVDSTGSVLTDVELSGDVAHFGLAG